MNAFIGEFLIISGAFKANMVRTTRAVIVKIISGAIPAKSLEVKYWLKSIGSPHPLQFGDLCPSNYFLKILCK
jgi:NADH:ubiquinone oxidoreductase subunit 4 (subunit M)